MQTYGKCRCRKRKMKKCHAIQRCRCQQHHMQSHSHQLATVDKIKTSYQRQYQQQSYKMKSKFLRLFSNVYAVRYSDLYRKSQCAIWGNLWNFIDDKLLFIDVIVRFKLNKNAKVHRSPFTNLSITLFRIKIEFSNPFVVFTLDQATFTFFHKLYNRCIDCKQQTTPKW